MKKPKSPPPIPPLRLHKGSGQGYVVLDGLRHYVGRYGLPDTQAKYDRLTAEWLKAGRRLPVEPKAVTLAEVCAAYWRHVQTRYPECSGTGQPVGEAWTAHTALKPVTERYGDIKAVEFGPLRLKVVRDTFIQRGLNRRYVNRLTHRIVRMFRWAVAEEMIPPAALQALEAVAGLRHGETTAPESIKVNSVPDAIVDETLKHCTPTIRAMIELQRHTGMRPGEVCTMRTADIDTTSKVWLYTPMHHKTEHAGKSRPIYLGPKGQEVIGPFLKLETLAYIFSPAQSERERLECLHAKRVTPKGQGNEPGTNRRRRARKPGGRYTTQSYGKAIAAACMQAWPAPIHPPKGTKGETLKKWRKENHKALLEWRREHRWHPHQLRHAYATRVKREHGVETARILLGHSSVNVTELYGEADTAKAIRVARKIG